MNNYIDINSLVPGVKFKDFFTEEEYKAFRERYIKKVVPVLEEQRRQRARSEQDARNNLLY